MRPELETLIDHRIAFREPMAFLVEEQPSNDAFRNPVKTPRVYL
jgi:hypothetical protein